MGHHAKQAKSHEKLVGDLYQQIGQLHTQVDWLKKNLNLTKEEKRNMIEPNHPLSIQTQCQLLGLSRSAYYYQPKLVDLEEEELMNLLDKHYIEHPCEGKIKRAKYLTEQVG